MDLVAILKKIDVTVVRHENPAGQNTLRLFLRINRDKIRFAQWRGVIEEYLLDAKTKAAKTNGWNVDISQAYYVTDEEVVRYLWRVVISGNIRAGAEALGQAVLRVVSQSADVTEFPLVGRKKYAFDPANGKMKGAHDLKSAQSIVATGLQGGGQ